MHLFGRVAAIALPLLLLGGWPAAAADLAVWVYDFARWSEDQREAKSAALPAGTRHVYAGVEDGPRLLLEDRFWTADIQRSVEILRERPGIAVHATILQDTRWLDDPAGALQRLALVLEANLLRPHQAFAGVHVDVEPHRLEEWECGDTPARRSLVQKHQRLLARIAQAISPQTKNIKGRLQLSATLPWWIASLSADIPEALPSRWLDHLDEIVLMAYGEPGGPLVGGSSRALLQRLENARLWQGIPPGKGIRIGLATYEYANRAELLATGQELDKALGHQGGYRGTAIFHSDGAYGAPLVASVRGLVQDPVGRPVARARVRIGHRETVTNRCGRFGLRDLPSPTVELKVGGLGLQTLIVPVAGLTPGRELEIPPVVVDRHP